MLGFGAISELPLSSLPTGAESATHAGTATLSTTASVANAPSLEIHLVSSISASATTAAVGGVTKLGDASLSSTATTAALPQPFSGSAVLSASATLVPVQELTLKAVILVTGPAAVSANGEVTKLGVSSLSASGTVAAAGELTKLGTVSLSSVASITGLPQGSPGSAAISGSATVSGSGVLTKLGTATLSASGSTLSVGIVHIGAASLLADASTISGKIVGTFTLAKGLSSSATITNTPSVNIPAISAMSVSGTISSVGFIEKLGIASLNSGSPFTLGFSQGFQRGSNVSGHGTVEQNTLSATATLIAKGTVNRLSQSVLLSANASMVASHAIVSNLQSIGSLTGNSVLLHGGSVNLNVVVRIQPRLSTDYEQPDTITFTLYIDKLRSINGHINKTRDLTGYIDKQLSVTSNIDIRSGITGYIDKVVEKTLVRER
jgi:hypothetical protein